MLTLPIIWKRIRTWRIVSDLLSLANRMDDVCVTAALPVYGTRYGQDDGTLHAPKHVENKMSAAIVTSATWWLKIVRAFDGDFNHSEYLLTPL